MIDPQTAEVRGMRAGIIPLSARLKYSLARIIKPDIVGEPIPPDQRAIVPDISHYEGNVDFGQMELAGGRAVVAKCTQGTTIFDSKYNQFVNDCDNLPLGSYHFIENSNGTVQADWYTSHLGPHMISFTHWVDVERTTMDSAYIYQWAVRVKNNLHLADYSTIGIYSSRYFMSLVTGGYKEWIARNLRKWVAHYGVDAPSLPDYWTTYDMHQYTPSGDGHLYGCDALEVDLNRARKTWIARFEPPPPTLEERVTRLEERVTALEQGA